MEKKRKGHGPSILSYFKKRNSGVAAAASTSYDEEADLDKQGEGDNSKLEQDVPMEEIDQSLLKPKNIVSDGSGDAGSSKQKRGDDSKGDDEQRHGFIEPNDIGRALDKPLRDEEKLTFLKGSWKPPMSYSFPVQKEGNQNRKFKHEWLNQHKWLSYSQLLEGALCHVCVLFAPSGAGIGSQALKTFVKEPLTKYKKAKEDLVRHENTNYHKFSMEKAVEFTKTMDTPENRIDVVLDSKSNAIIELNRKRLRPIIKTIIFCARNNLPLRGHRDYRLIPDLRENSEDSLGGKHGVFQGLLAFRIDAGDQDLKHHFDTCNKNSSMVSNTVQNEIIDCIGEGIRETLANNIKQAKFYSILCDETTDISTKEQMTFCVRYVNTDNCVIREDFLSFTDLKSTTGASIEEAINNELETLGLSYQYLCGQGYDGGSNMAGKFKGVQARILNKQPLAVYTHCFSHSLNLAISKSCETSAVRNMMGIVGSLSAFLSASANRKNALEDIISQLPVIESKKTKLKAMCPTRWVERHDTLITFKELLIPVVTLLDNLSSSNDANAETTSKACMFSSAVRRGEFLVALEVTAYCFSVTIRLSEQLQNPRVDLAAALNHVTDVLEVFKNARRDGELEFGNIFENALSAARDIGCDISMPRSCSRQTHRENVPASNIEEYFRRSIFCPVIDHFISELETRFSQNFRAILPLEGLIPTCRYKYEEKEVMKAAEIYESHLDNLVVIRSEVKLWRAKWEKEAVLPATSIEALQHCDKQFFPNVFTLLQIFATIPVSTSTAERSFSTLRRIKTYLRSTMGQTRLNGLAMANIHREVEINVEKVINIFSRKKKRRMLMSNWNED